MRTNHLFLRSLIYGQIAWIIVVGLTCRGVILVPDAVLRSIPRIVEMAIAAVVIGSVYAFPICAAIAIFRARLSGVKSFVLFIIELALAATYVLALLPAVQ